MTHGWVLDDVDSATLRECGVISHTVEVAASCSCPSFVSALRVSCSRRSTFRFPSPSTSPVCVHLQAHLHGCLTCVLLFLSVLCLPSISAVCTFKGSHAQRPNPMPRRPSPFLAQPLFSSVATPTPRRLTPTPSVRAALKSARLINQLKQAATPTPRRLHLTPRVGAATFLSKLIILSLSSHAQRPRLNAQRGTASQVRKLISKTQRLGARINA
ncbi:hypothetical protein PIB30_061151 [Stylosanthes scabra]|uniref:Transmembrane protein n=1 Tax=Stylosanthes scabra TaxID=79078 RepID=A0ABU6VK01_9FABA|nr:hypothetical protein [Stylosanthes scabra]